ncbi:uncharacterized protein LOC107036748 [Diachasma alloeum]|uniref:uncharacterized protein LOC107036748 n=1 Tax=Diachasma alloeum TaxID=454923 RepID=UPI00073836E6|nr:uncharacterized protein LOC107036748 [Diachasma alloeum]
MAPFKFHFSKMSKSRSKDSRNSTESEEPTCLSQTTSRSTPETPAIENIGGIPENSSDVSRSSPPPSYEYVLEETRMGQTANVVEEQTESASDTETHQGDEVGGTSIQNIIETPRPEMHKSSKELYRAVAKQWGITCKMSDHCRCFDCQSHYFDCEYEKDEQAKTDGGLSAGTPMFLAEVMHGTACVLL